MRLTMKERKRVAEATAGRYRKAGKKEKGVILNEFVELTGFARCYAAVVLRNQGRVVQVDRKLRVRGDVGKRLRRPGRGPTYDEAVVKALVQVWRIMDYICGKRLAPVLGEIVERLLRHNELRCDVPALSGWETCSSHASRELRVWRGFRMPAVSLPW
jgi:hypothetical protein